MEAILIKNDAWPYVSSEIVKPEMVEGNADSVEAARVWDVKDKKAKSDIIMSIKPSELKQIKGSNTSKEVWIKLKSIYQSSGPARKATLLKKLTLQKIDDSEDVRDHLRSFFDTLDKLSEMEIDINPDLLSVMLLYSLPPSFENFRCAIESRDELPSPENLRIKIIEEYDARKNETREVTTSAMFAKKRSNTRQSANRNANQNVNSKRVTKKDDGQKSELFKYKCHRCRKVGHKAAECTESRRQIDNTNAADNISLYARDDFSFITGALDIDEPRRGQEWCLDSGCSAHMCNDSTKFANVVESSAGSVKLASESGIAPIRGKGSVSIVVEEDGRSKDVRVNDVLCVLDLRTSLLSVGKITDRGFAVHFDQHEAKIIDQDMNTILTADRRNGLYYLRETHHQYSASVEVTSGTATEE